MKKHLPALLLAAGLIALPACSAPASEAPSAEDEMISIVATSFHEYDWLRAIIGEEQDSIDLQLLLDSGVDMHSYEPSVEDITRIASADLFVHNGSSSDTWVDDMLAQPMNEGLNVIHVMEALGEEVVPERTIEGMQATEHAHDHDEDAHSEDAHDYSQVVVEVLMEVAKEVEEADIEDALEEVEAHCEDAHDHDEAHSEDAHDHDEETHSEGGHDDEHVWLSLQNAALFCDILADAVIALDPDNAEMYDENLTQYLFALEALDAEYEAVVTEAPRDTLIFTDRFPFLYMMDDYGIEYYAAFQGCSAETEASFETVAFLSDKVNELDVNHVLVLENGLEELGQTVFSNSERSDGSVLTLHSIQSVNREQIDAGVSYLSLMEDNLAVLEMALAE